MISIAVILFPGINTEYETRREIERAGMRADFFRWNEDPSKLKKYDGFVIGGGFTYEDRGRSGIIAALDPLISVLRAEILKGKPLLGICNGCQIAIESGLAPDTENGNLCFGMARNRRMIDGEIVGTGYYNDWVYLRNVAPKGRTAFTRHIEEGESFTCPVAHGEGRFATRIPGLIDKLIKNKQVVFRYCDKNGGVSSNFPINPNGSLWNIAAVCNARGNVLVLMPHFERSEESQTFFKSMKEYIEEGKKGWEKAKNLSVSLGKELSAVPHTHYSPDSQSFQFLVDLTITDNEADTFQNALKRLGFNNVKISRQSHFEIAYQNVRGKGSLEKYAGKIIESGVLANTAKEKPTMVLGNERLAYSRGSRRFMQTTEEKKSEGAKTVVSLLVREKQDFIGLSKMQSLQSRLKMKEVSGVKTGTVWHLEIDTKSEAVKAKLMKQLIKTRLFGNPHIQDIFLF